MTSLRILADENIPFVDTLFAPLGELRTRPGRQIVADDLDDIDVLIVRSVTRVDEALLAKSPVRFVGTCTIGIDHLDTAYLDDRGIVWTSAPGCNANAVVQYVLSALAYFDVLQEMRRVVVIGGGNVGSRVYHALTQIGLDCSCIDPFLTVSCGMRLVPFDEIYNADIVCLHTPLTRAGPYPTENMIDYGVLAGLKEDVVLLNAGRGEVVDNDALAVHLGQAKKMRVALDVWANEPHINRNLLARVQLATPHIAGYSLEGRVNGALMVFAELGRYLDLAPLRQQSPCDQVTQAVHAETQNIVCDSLRACLLKVYDVSADDRTLRQGLVMNRGAFDYMRKHYPMRREYPYFRCQVTNSGALDRYRALGFVVDE